TWLRWKGQKVEFCRCAVRGRVRCHEIPVTKCFVSKCYNGGTCKEAVYSNDFICLCPPGFTGTQCEINTAERCSGGQGLGYRGTWSISMSGLECINWNSSSLRGKKFTARRPEANTLGLGNHNYCRNPDGDTKPWCYVYKKAQFSWEFCFLPTCIIDPYLECTRGSGQTYRGTKAVSRSGLKCLSWDSPAVSRKIYNAWRSDAREMGIGSHNFSRKTPSITTLGPRAPITNNNQGETRLRVVLGRTFRLQNSSSEQIFDVEKYWIHEQYDDETYDNDIALLKLKSEFGICALHSPEVLPACLPEPNLCEISGYGKEEEFSPFYSERIKRGLVRLWPQEQCVPEKLSGRLVTPNMLCAGDTRGLDDACKGDSGGPLVCPKNGRMTLMGLISWGDGCGKKDTPGVYTRVTNYTNWISSKMRAN
uniref:Plasminogen activator, tissue type n=1 Tax=Sinocyclocheilus grahami TaxID=75366 RepID=A0A672QTZ4_SINGR